MSRCMQSKDLVSQLLAGTPNAWDLVIHGLWKHLCPTVSASEKAVEGNSSGRMVERRASSEGGVVSEGGVASGSEGEELVKENQVKRV